MSCPWLRAVCENHEREKIVGWRRGEVEIKYHFGSEAEGPHGELR